MYIGSLNYKAQTFRRLTVLFSKVLGLQEGTCDEYWVPYGSVESLNCTSESNTLLTNLTLNNNLKNISYLAVS